MKLNSKICKTCEVEFLNPTLHFHKKKGNKDNLNTECRSCNALRYKRYRENNLEKERARSKRYRSTPEAKAKEKIRKKQYNQRPEVQEARRRNAKLNRRKRPEYFKERDRLRKQKEIQNDPLGKLKYQIRNNTKRYINKKTKLSAEIIGCSWEQLQRHLDSSFEANYGMPREWLPAFEVHIDHIIPLKTAVNDKDLIKLGHYSNLQYLLAEDNLNKRGTYDWEITIDSCVM